MTVGDLFGGADPAGKVRDVVGVRDWPVFLDRKVKILNTEGTEGHRVDLCDLFRGRDFHRFI